MSAGQTHASGGGSAIRTPISQDARPSPPEQIGLPAETHPLLFGVASRGLADLLGLTHDCLRARDREGRIILWNRAAEQLYGWTQTEALGQRPEALLNTKFPKPLAEIESELQATGRWEGQLVHVNRDGRLITVASRWVLEADEQGQPAAVLQLERDLSRERHLEQELGQARRQLERITEQKLSELEAANEALMESEARFQHVAEAIHDVFWLTNPWRTSILYVNPAYEKVWGRSCQSLYANPRSWLEAVHPEDRPRVRQFFSEPIPTQGYEHSYRVVRPDCSVRWVLDRGFPVREQAGGFRRVVGIVRDVTERKELEKELLAISEGEQRRMGQDLHDDLCQQLAGIEFLSKALQQQLKAQPLAEKAAEIAELIRAAIAYTRQLARGLSPLELEAEGLMRGLQAFATRTAELFKVDCTFESLSSVLVQDPAVSTHLYRIAQEAVANSIRHGKATRIRISLEAKPEGAGLTIRDNGAGFLGEANRSGGMGLRIMRYRCDVIGGTFALHPNTPTGTTVQCVFPLTAW